MAHYFPPPPAPGSGSETVFTVDESAATAAAAHYCNNAAALQAAVRSVELSPELLSKLDATGRSPRSGDVKYMFLTKSGPGPIRQPREDSLLNEDSGLCKEPGPKHKRMKIN